MWPLFLLFNYISRMSLLGADQARPFVNKIVPWDLLDNITRIIPELAIIARIPE